MISEVFGVLWREFSGRPWASLPRVVGFSFPLTALPAWMAPALALGALLALAVAAGIALASLGSLLSALLIAHLLLERVFGITVALTPAA
jgi:hypothetical protein